MRNVFVMISILAALAAGCALNEGGAVYDARTGSEICEIHHTLMQAVIIKNPDLKDAPTQQYLEARLKGFVHSRPFYLPPECKRAMVYICEDCTNAENQWRAQHPDLK